MAFMGASISRRLYPIPVQWPRIAGALLAGVLAYLVGTLWGPGWFGAFGRLSLAGGFPLFVWHAVFDETDRTEVRRALGGDVAATNGCSR